MKTYIVKFHTYSDSGQVLYGRVVESCTFKTDKPIIWVRQQVEELKQYLEGSNPNGVCVDICLYDLETESN